MQTRPFLSIIIPAYNEEKRIARTLLAVDKYVNSKQFREILRAEGYLRDGEGYEILVVDDGSRDNTVGVVERFTTIMRNLRLLSNAENHGKGFVVRQGMMESRGAYRLFTDADSSTPIEEVEKLLPYAKGVVWRGAGTEKDSGAYDVVIGSIGLKESAVEKHEQILRVLAGKMGNWLIQCLVLWGIHDTQRGFKIFTAQAAENVFKRLLLNRWSFDIEALAVSRRLGYKIKEVPIRWIHDPASKVTAGAYLNTLLEVFKIKWYLIANKHQIQSTKSKTL